MLIITHFSKTYPGNSEPVINIPKLEISQVICWMKGENGSGKTTLLKSIAGLMPFEGNISMDGMDINNNRMAYTKIVNYAEAEPRYPPFLTGKELIDFYKVTKGGQFPEYLFKHFGVEKFMQHQVATYSSGMLKKLSLVLGFTGDVALVLLDEPLIALDVTAVDILQTTIREYSQRGVLFLITSHQELDPGLVGPITNFCVKNKKLEIETV